MIRNVLAGVGLLVVGWVAWTWVQVRHERREADALNPYRRPDRPGSKPGD